MRPITLKVATMLTCYNNMTDDEKADFMMHKTWLDEGVGCENISLSKEIELTGLEQILRETDNENLSKYYHTIPYDMWMQLIPEWTYIIGSIQSATMSYNDDGLRTDSEIIGIEIEATTSKGKFLCISSEDDVPFVQEYPTIYKLLHQLTDCGRARITVDGVDVRTKFEQLNIGYKNPDAHEI